MTSEWHSVDEFSIGRYLNHSIDVGDVEGIPQGVDETVKRLAVQATEVVGKRLPTHSDSSPMIGANVTTH